MARKPNDLLNTSTNTSRRWVGASAALALLGGLTCGVATPTSVADAQPFPALLGAGVGVLCGLWALASAAQRSLEWCLAVRRRSEKTTGVVRGRTEDKQPSDYAYVYQRILRVSYRVDGRVREFNYAPSSGYSNGSAIMDRIDKKYPDGAEVTVRYERGHPENAGVGSLWFPPVVAVPLLAAFAALAFGTAFVAASACVRAFAG
jgi:hypothetical protein